MVPGPVQIGRVELKTARHDTSVWTSVRPSSRPVICLDPILTVNAQYQWGQVVRMPQPVHLDEGKQGKKACANPLEDPRDFASLDV